jgi:lipopolysaccharide transport system permease protein
MAKHFEWEWEIKPNSTWFGNGVNELFAYKDLLLRLVRKEFLISYQQTLLGPFWVVLQPILTVFTYVLIFDKVIGVSTEGIPSFIYYLAGIILWNLFSELFLNIAYTFTQNAGIFSKVYFPRLIAPLSMLLLNLFRFGIQLVLLLFVLAYYYITGQVGFDLLHVLMFIPVVIITAGLGFGAGLFFSIITTKYKDIFGLLQLIVRLLMFVCPIFYSLAIVPDRLKWLVNINPLSSQFELFRYAFLGIGHFEGLRLLYSACSMIFLMFLGILLFNKMGDKLMDVV